MLNGWTIGVARYMPDPPPDPKADKAHVYMACPLCEFIFFVTDEVEGPETPFDETREWAEGHEMEAHPTYVRLNREALSLVTA